MINVTKTFLPPFEDYQNYVKRAFDSAWLTNRGELLKELEDKLKDYLKVKNILILNNGTVPIQIAIKLLGKGSEIITTPFSYVATTSSIVWENCKPVFVDIHPEYLTIDETKIEAVITDKTSAILATHVYGNPCHVDAIEKIAKKHNLKVIYDAAHCFGVTYNGRSIFEYGDVSTCSFHATKVFQTGEGGAIFTNNKELAHQVFYSHNFGHDGPLKFHGLGINGKISELHAAMGLSVLPYMDEVLEGRKKVTEYYDDHIDFSNLSRLRLREGTQWNYCYYPIIFKTEEDLLKTEAKLKKAEIFPRRYFYPSLNTLPYVTYTKMEVAERVAKNVLCLPLYYGLEIAELKKIVDTLNS